jgi:hypothetical protein
MNILKDEVSDLTSHPVKPNDDDAVVVVFVVVE